MAKQLLLMHRGVVDINACDEKQKSLIVSTGSPFVVPLEEIMGREEVAYGLDANHDGFVHWREAFPVLKERTTDREPRQTPRAYFFPDNREGLGWVRL